MMMTTNMLFDNDVNDTDDSGCRVRQGRGRACQVVSQRKPCRTDRRGAPLRVGTWNVRTLLREGKLANVIAEMKRGNINILGLSETR